jgi:hypothetical protein
MVSLFKYWRLIVGGISVLSLLGGLFYYGHVQYRKGYKAAEDSYKSKLEVIREKRNEIEKEVNQASDADLNARLEPWFRD